MHKMLKLYFDEHVDFGNKDLELQKNKEYIDNEKKYEEIKNEIYGLLTPLVGKDKAFDIINKLDELCFISSIIREEYSFEYGFYTAINVVFNFHNTFIK